MKKFEKKFEGNLYQWIAYPALVSPNSVHRSFTSLESYDLWKQFYINGCFHKSQVKSKNIFTGIYTGLEACVGFAPVSISYATTLK